MIDKCSTAISSLFCSMSTRIVSIVSLSIGVACTLICISGAYAVNGSKALDEDVYMLTEGAVFSVLLLLPLLLALLLILFS